MNFEDELKVSPKHVYNVIFQDLFDTCMWPSEIIRGLPRSQETARNIKF